MTPRTDLIALLQDDPDANLQTLQVETDMKMSIGQDVLRLRWRRALTCAVAADADLSTTCGALLDVLAVRERELDTAADDVADLADVHVLINRPFPTAHPAEVDLAMRSMRDAIEGVCAHVWYRTEDGGWREDDRAAPKWNGDPRVAKWVSDLLLPRLTAQPKGLALDIVAAVDDLSLQLYPSPISGSNSDEWALRIDGLEIGRVTSTKATLKIGEPGKNGDGKQRQAFVNVFGASTVRVSADSPTPEGQLNLTEAAMRIRELIRHFRAVDIPGSPIGHRERKGRRILDEHTLEARLLKGIVRFDDSGETQLVANDTAVARGSQFPTLWGGKDRKLLDAMLRRGRTPLAIELKVSTGGQGRYYRRSLVQAVLYRHFIRNADPLDAWFKAAQLDRLATVGVIGVPIPTRWDRRFQDALELNRRVAARVGVEVVVLDDRFTPAWESGLVTTEPGPDEVERLTWQLAAALVRRWPKSLGRVRQARYQFGHYDQVILHSALDPTVSIPSPGPRVSLTRPGSLRVHSPSGSERWVWSNVWIHLGAGGSFEEAAEHVGGVAGLMDVAPSDNPTFPQRAAEFLTSTHETGWRWESAWTEEGIAWWLQPHLKAFASYLRSGIDGPRIPTVARLWGATRDGEVALIIDQHDLKTWRVADGKLTRLLT